LLHLLAEALSAARAIGDEFARASALSAVAERLPPDALEQMYAVLLEVQATITQAYQADRIARILTPRWPEIAHCARQSEVALLTDTLQAFARATRPNLLAAIQALLPVIERFGDQAALQQTVQAIVDTAQRWP
jgi:hypothetical protein